MTSTCGNNGLSNGDERPNLGRWFRNVYGALHCLWKTVKAKLKESSKACTRWCASLCNELSRSPLTQLMFFLTLVGLFFGALSAWQTILGAVSRHWGALCLACSLSIIAVALSRRLSRRQALQSFDYKLCEALDVVKQLVSNNDVSYAEAESYLRQRFGGDAKMVLDSLLAKGVVRLNANERIIVKGSNTDE